MNSNQAIQQVLEKCHQPLHYREITKRILENGTWQSEGKTPEATVNSKLALDIKEKGDVSIFQRVADGTYALRSWGLPHYDGNKKRTTTHDKAALTEQNAQSTILTFNNAAEKVLEKYANEQPMHYEKITQKILELGLVYTEGQTPEATLYAQMLTEINRSLKRGDTPRFVKHGKGFFGLQ